MVQPNRIAFIGNSLPRRCGIATFTTDLEASIAASGVPLETFIVAMTDNGRTYDYPANVRLEINDARLEDYARAADALNTAQVDVVSLQHEFGIFGGDAGDYVLSLLSKLNMPVVTTLHTILAKPSAMQHRVMSRIIDISAKVIVMAEKGRSLLREVYDAPSNKIEIIPHGVPDVPFAEPDAAKATLGFGDRAVILTFGLLSPNKGVEVMIEAMPEILRKRPDALYVVLGSTHPNLVRQQGEAYRNSLIARAEALGVADHVLFCDQFVDLPKLLSYISACDVYVTPYLNEAQMTSGTLAYSFGLGKAVVSTPYWHARELLADGGGVLVPFGDVAATADEIGDLLSNEPRRLAMRERAYARSRPTTWPRTAERYLEVFARAQTKPRFGARAEVNQIRPPLDMRLGHFLAMCDDTGLYQHAVHTVPDRAHGYCVDDNARALLLACALNTPGERRLPDALVSRFAAFVQHAWNPDTKRFRNFMSFDRRWLEDVGSEDSQARTLWALGVCAGFDASPARRRWAANLFAEALPGAETFAHARGTAFTLLGLDAYCDAVPRDASAKSMRAHLAKKLFTAFSDAHTPEWRWCEPDLAYDNARLCHALIVSGQALDAPEMTAMGLTSLRWLIAKQTAPAGHFRPIGTHGYGAKNRTTEVFDQQPLEAFATISACLAGWRADDDDAWTVEAARAFAWFHGENDLSTPLADAETGGCRDGLHPDRANENQGAESILAYLISLAEMRALARHEAETAARAQTPIRSWRAHA